MLADLIADRRVVEVRIAGQEMVAVAEDVPRLRDGLGIPVPPGIAATFNEPATRPIDDLVLRWARTHAPLSPLPIAERATGWVGRWSRACNGLVGPTLVSGSFMDCLLSACYRVMLPQSPVAPSPAKCRQPRLPSVNTVMPRSSR